MIPGFLFKRMGTVAVSVTKQGIQEKVNIVGTLGVVNVSVWDTLRFTNT